MPNYRLQFSGTDQPKPIQAVTWSARNPRDAFIMAQGHTGPTELWKDDEHVCTLQRIGLEGEIWLISRRGKRGKT